MASAYNYVKFKNKIKFRKKKKKKMDEKRGFTGFTSQPSMRIQSEFKFFQVVVITLFSQNLASSPPSFKEEVT